MTTTASTCRIALIGAGTIARTHMDRINRCGGMVLAGIADPTQAGRSMADDLDVPWFADHRSLLEALKPQGVVIATPNDTHIPIALDCLAHGVAALVEKPLADTVSEARLLVDAQQRTGVPVLVGHHRRYNPIIRRAREIIDSGRLGRLLTASVMSTFFKPKSYFEAAWRRQSGGGPVLINLIHDIDMLRFLMGEVESVQAMSSNASRGFEVEDTAAAVLRFTSGALATVLVSDATTSPWSWDFCAGEQDQYPRQNVQSHFISGTDGALSLPDLALWNYQGERSWHAELTKEQTVVHKADPYTLQMLHFKAVIEGVEAPLCSALDGLRTLEATLAVKSAAASGLAVSCTLSTLV